LDIYFFLKDLIVGLARNAWLSINYIVPADQLSVGQQGWRTKITVPWSFLSCKVMHRGNPGIKSCNITSTYARWWDRAPNGTLGFNVIMLFV
jgi:hypothetical protein